VPTLGALGNANVANSISCWIGPLDWNFGPGKSAYFNRGNCWSDYIETDVTSPASRILQVHVQWLTVKYTNLELESHLYLKGVFPVLIFRCRFQWSNSLRRGPAATRLLGLRVQIPSGQGCRSVVGIVCCQVCVSATDRFLIQRSPTDCGVSLIVI
jgi:hypothetical protein